MEQRDCGGTLVAAADFGAGGALSRAWVRIADGSWVGIEPRATCDAPWGLSDRAWHAPRGAGPRAARPPADFEGCVPLTVFEAIDWTRVDRIVPGAEPARLPPGAAPPVFNLIATLAAAQGVAALRYTGPYPSEALFLGLLEAFRYAPERRAEAITAEGRNEAVPPMVDDPLDAFQRGELAWVPAPHEPLFVADDLYVQLRGRIEKVVWRGTTYHRADAQGIARHAALRVRDAADGVRCGLWALGRPLVDHLLLSPAGELLDVLEAPPENMGRPETAPQTPQRSDAPRQSRGTPRLRDSFTGSEDVVVPAPAEVWPGVVAAVVAQSAAPLASSILEVAAELRLEWGPLVRDLVRVEGRRVRADTRLRHALADALAVTSDAAVRSHLALAALAEIAAGVGDTLRGRAQARLATRPEGEQRAALEAIGWLAAGAEEARAITAAVAVLLRGSRRAGLVG